MTDLRRELDGLRLVEPGRADVWLVFEGQRHRIASPKVYDALFSEAENLVHCDEIPSIAMGPELNDGTCLVRGLDTHAIFLVTGRYPKVRRHHIPTFESFNDFGFALTVVRDVPAILVDNIPLGPDLVSVADRRRREE